MFSKEPKRLETKQKILMKEEELFFHQYTIWKLYYSAFQHTKKYVAGIFTIWVFDRRVRATLLRKWWEEKVWEELLLLYGQILKL